MKFDIRLATLDDAKYCANIHSESWNFAYSDIVSKEIIDKYNVRWPMIWNKMLSNNINSHYVITLDDVIIGFLTISVARDNDLKDSFYELVGLYLNPEYVAKGYGKQAMDWIKKKSKAGDMIKFLYGYWKKIIVQGDFMKKQVLCLMEKQNQAVLQILKKLDL